MIGDLDISGVFLPTLLVLMGITYLVYLPAGYQRGAGLGRRFGVLYLLHAPPGRPDGYFLAGAIGVQADILIAHHRIPPLLIIAPYAKTSRYDDDTEWANAGAGRYEDLVLEVVHDADRRFVTAADRRHRALAGLSEGGFGALNVALHHLEIFSGVQSWSGYFTATASDAFKAASPATLRANSPSKYVPDLAPAIHRLGLRAWLYQGRSDDMPPVRLQQFAHELADAGANVTYAFFPGGHDWGLWRRQTRRMLTTVGAWFRRSTSAETSHLTEIGAP